MGGCPPSLWPRFQRYTLSGGGNDFSRWLPPRTRLHFTKTGHLFGAPPEDGYQSVGPVGRSTFFGQFGGRPRGVDGGSGATGVLVEGGVSRGEAPRPIRSAQRKILASFGGLEAISVRKRHYQFGKPRPPNWAIFLLNILLFAHKPVACHMLHVLLILSIPMVWEARCALSRSAGTHPYPHYYWTRVKYYPPQK